MHALLVQHGAYYGVSVKLINDETAEAVRLKLNADPRLVRHPIPPSSWYDKREECGIWLLPVDSDKQTFGFDTGMIDEGFTVIENILRDV